MFMVPPTQRVIPPYLSPLTWRWRKRDNHPENYRLLQAKIQISGLRVRYLRIGHPLFVHDQAGSALEREVRPHPLHKHKKAVLKSDQIINMDKEPHAPGEKTAHVQSPHLRHR